VAQNLMVRLLERRVVLSERAEQLADTEAEVARLEAAEIVYQQFQEDAKAGHPDAEAWHQALEEATGGAPAVPAQSADATPGAAGGRNPRVSMLRAGRRKGCGRNERKQQCGIRPSESMSSSNPQRGKRSISLSSLPITRRSSDIHFRPHPNTAFTY
jgi:hypothetical protein